VVSIPLRCFDTQEAEAQFLDIVREHLPVKGRDRPSLTPVVPEDPATP
jgi:hypothetical protein